MIGGSISRSEMARSLPRRTLAMMLFRVMLTVNLIPFSVPRQPPPPARGRRSVLRAPWKRQSKAALPAYRQARWMTLRLLVRNGPSSGPFADCGSTRLVSARSSHPPVPVAARRPTICTATTFTMVIDGKIIAYPISGRSVGRHASRIDENGRIARCARRNTDQVIKRNLQEVVADHQNDEPPSSAAPPRR